MVNVYFIARNIPFHRAPMYGDTAISLETILCISKYTNLKPCVIVTYSNRLSQKELRNIRLHALHIGCNLYTIRCRGSSLEETMKVLEKLLNLRNNECTTIVHILNVREPITVFMKLIKLLTKSICIKHVYMKPLGSWITQRSYYALCRILDSIDAFITTTKYLRTQLLELGIDKGRIFTIYPPVDHNFYRPLEDLKELKVKRTRKLILYIGSLNAMRFPLREILEALKKIRKCNRIELLVVTRGSRSDIEWALRLLKESRKRGLDVSVFAGYLPPSKRVLLYNLADVYLYLCRVPLDVVDPPLSVLEAMSCECVVVAHKVQSIPEFIINGTNGIIVDNLDPEIIADAIERALYENSSVKLGHNARRTIISCFNRTHYVRKLLNLYKRLVHGR